MNFWRCYGKKNLPKVAYFCMEYGLDTSLKIYAGGLGILAGLPKGAKDYDFPIVGIGIKWKQGYTDQLIEKTADLMIAIITITTTA